MQGTGRVERAKGGGVIILSNLVFVLLLITLITHSPCAFMQGHQLTMALRAPISYRPSWADSLWRVWLDRTPGAPAALALGLWLVRRWDGIRDF